MDGPNVNWKMLDLTVEDRNSNETYPNLLDVGSCNLHVVHGAFRTGMKQTGWGIDLLLKSSYSHLHETPARRRLHQNDWKRSVSSPTLWTQMA